ncbi:lipoprotein [Gordonia phage Eyre]|uniref:Lipoprotein n=1 Tax=Gordonia phage Eyre TaxID=1887646 RepID=A0A1B3AZY9_9CAUD|nr:lipoprotein [Gordonia phage Eyre]AOE44314.1 lipoprotein [Gordonia phage Eyre]
MSITRRLLVLVAAAALLAAGCSSDDGGSSSTTTETAAATTTTTTKPRPTLGRLNVPYELTDRSGGDQVKYSVTSIAVDGQCPDTYYNDIENGHLLVVGLDVETGADWDPEFGEMFRPRGGYWTIIGDDGVTESGITSAASYGCADSQIPQTFDPDSRYQFSIAFDTRNASGMLQHRVGDSTTRWEY